MWLRHNRLKLTAALLGGLVCAIAGSGASAAPTASNQATEGDDALGHQAIGAFRAGRFAEASRLFERALAALERRLPADHPDVLTALDNLGTALSADGRLAQARPIYERAVAGRTRALGGEHPDTLVSMYNLGTLFESQRQYDQARPLREQVAAIRERRLQPGDPLLLGSLYRLAFVYDRLSLRERAERLYARVLEAQRRALGPDHADTLRSLESLSLVQKLRGRFQQAEENGRDLLARRERVAGPEAAATNTARLLLADIYGARSRFGEAQTLIERAVASRERASGPNSLETLSALIYLADHYRARRRLEDAEAVLLRVVAGMTRSLRSGDQNLLSAQDSLADVYSAQARFAEAEGLYAQVLAGRESANGPDSPDVLDTLSKLGATVSAQGRLSAAEPMIQRAIDTRRRRYGESHVWTLGSIVAMADLRERQQRFDDAIGLYRRAADGLERALGAEHPDRLRALNALLRLYLSQRRSADALTTARALSASAAARFARPAGSANIAAERVDRIRWFADVADALWLGANGNPDRRLIAEAFIALQHTSNGRADTAVAQMAARRGASSSTGLADIARERELLAERLTAMELDLAAAYGATAEAGPALRDELMTERAAVTQRLTALEAQLRAEFPAYSTLVQPQPLSLDEATRLLGQDEALLLVVPGERATHLLAITSEGARWSRSDWTASQVNAAVRRLRWQVGGRTDVDAATAAAWTAAEPSGAPIAFDRAVSHDLYRAILAPITPQLVGRNRLTVIAGGSLASLPFALLVTSASQGRDNDPDALRATSWLADQLALSYAPSARALATLRTLPTMAGPRNGFFGVGDPVLGAARPSGARVVPEAPLPIFAAGFARSGRPLADVRLLARLTRLPGTAVELNDMARSFGAGSDRLLLAAQASETRVRAADLNSAAVLAFATHGLMAYDLNGIAEPGLVLTPPATATDADDGYLAASEISAMNLAADWVILSACDTATAGPSDEGLSALSRAFLYAGARSLLASHWPVNDTISARITARAVQLAAGGFPRAVAFQQAMREARQDRDHDTPRGSWAHPAYWAPFVLIGDSGR